MSPKRSLSLMDWLDERLKNCQQIAKSKHGDDRQGWLEDAHYFTRAKEAVRLLGQNANASLNLTPEEAGRIRHLLHSDLEGWGIPDNAPEASVPPAARVTKSAMRKIERVLER